jgi:aspartyl-tRNA(Asn)/glutamyl-tRNA(Gln) amidotransferase subunit C
MDAKEVRRLATLARIDIGDAEAENLSKEFDSILGYVADVKNAVSETQAKEPKSLHYPLHNILRDDNYAHESGQFTNDILNNAPAREGDFVRVKKIL